MRTPKLERAAFLLLLAVVTVAFAAILFPFSGAVMWGVALAILFTPPYRWLVGKMSSRRNLAAFATLLVALVVVILPLVGIAFSLVDEVSMVAQRMRSGDISLANYFQHIVAALPAWALTLLERFGLGDADGLIDRLSQGIARSSQLIASQALNIGQNTFEFLISVAIMLYLLFFLLRDGTELSKTIRDSLPLSQPHTTFLLNKFTTVIRATIKGNIAVAAAQGFIGGLAFWFLDVQGALVWGVLMAFLSLLPAVGAALIWGPVAVYFLVTGAIWQGLTMLFIGVFAIGLIDNILRPILVGKDTQMPDYIVLLSTIGGLALFGINGFVIGPVIAALFMAAWGLFAAAGDTDASGPA